MLGKLRTNLYVKFSITWYKILPLIACHVGPRCAQLYRLKTNRGRIPVGPVLLTCDACDL